MQTLNLPKIDGSSTLPAAEYNSLGNESQNLVTGSGQALAGGDLNQFGKAAAIYGAGGDYYVDSGLANAYVLTVINSKQAPHAYFDGMRVRFLPANTNSGASVINVNGLGSKPIKLDTSGTALPGGYIVTNKECELTYNDGGGYFVLKNQYAATAKVQSGQYITASSSGTDTYTASLSPAINAYTANMTVNIAFTAINTTTTPTLNINGIGAKTIVNADGGAVIPGQVQGLRILYFDQPLDKWVLRDITIFDPPVRAVIASVYLPTDFTLPTGGDTKIPISTVDFDTASSWNSGSTRFNPKVPGFYNITACVLGYSPTTSGPFSLQVWKNGGSPLSWRISEISIPAANKDTGLSGSIVIYMNGTTDYLELAAGQSTGADVTIHNGSGNTFMQISLIGK
jgi:hypothetical protein